MERYNNNNQQQLGQGAEAQQNESMISVRDLIFLVLNNWYWFVISVLVCLIVAAFVYKAQPKTYTASGTIMVRDNGNQVKYQSRNMDQILSNMGMDNSNLSLENEIYMLRSSWLMSQVVERLNLNYPCTRNDLFKKITYYRDAPLELSVGDSAEGERDLTFRVRVTPKPNNKYEFRAYKFGHEISAEAYYSQQVKFDDTVTFKVEKTDHYTDAFEDVDLNLAALPVIPLAREMIHRLTISRVDKMASVIAISFEDPNRKRANEIVDTLIAVYNDDAVEDKNKVAQKTEVFITERIALISGELGAVDAQVASIKSASGLGELSGASGTVLQASQRYSEEVVKLETELNLISSVRNYVSDPVNKEELIPVNVGVADPGIQTMIVSYNHPERHIRITTRFRFTFINTFCKIYPLIQFARRRDSSTSAAARRHIYIRFLERRPI